MNKKVLCAGVIAVAAMGLAWHFKRERNACIIETNRLARDLAALQHRSNDDRRQERDSLVSSVVRGQTSGRKPEENGFYANLKNDPAMQSRYDAYEKARFAITYASLFRALGLSPAQIDQFLDNKVKYNENMRDISASLEAEGLSPYDPAGRKLVQEASQEYNAAQVVLLGPDGMAQAKQFENLAPAHECVDDLDGLATLEGAPLSAEQVAALTSLISQAMQPDTSGKWKSLGDLDWSAVDATAQTFLSPAQFDMFTTTETPGPTGTGGSKFMHQMISQVQAGAREDASSGKN
jgi:hypothetical protein